jgi:hypothetical protein
MLAVEGVPGIAGGVVIVIVGDHILAAEIAVCENPLKVVVDGFAALVTFNVFLGKIVYVVHAESPVNKHVTVEPDIVPEKSRELPEVGVAVTLGDCVIPIFELGILGRGKVIVALVVSTALETAPVIFGEGAINNKGLLDT